MLTPIHNHVMSNHVQFNHQQHSHTNFSSPSQQYSTDYSSAFAVTSLVFFNIKNQNF